MKKIFCSQCDVHRTWTNPGGEGPLVLHMCDHPDADMSETFEKAIRYSVEDKTEAPESCPRRR